MKEFKENTRFPSVYYDFIRYAAEWTKGKTSENTSESLMNEIFQVEIRKNDPASVNFLSQYQQCLQLWETADATQQEAKHCLEICVAPHVLQGYTSPDHHWLIGKRDRKSGESETKKKWSVAILWKTIPQSGVVENRFICTAAVCPQKEILIHYFYCFPIIKVDIPEVWMTWLSWALDFCPC